MNTVAELNDRFRANPHNGLGRFVVTRSVHDLGPEFVAKAVAAVKAFKDFTKDNDPYQERDCFTFKVDDEELLFKIDYFDRTMQYASPNPADPHVTVRIGTIMLCEDY
jgi:ketosteroid isomerase-like protein